MSTLGKAIALAAKGFENVKDKSGKFYIEHCIYVMNNIKSKEDDVKIAAILHDAVEDNVATFEELSAMGFSTKVMRLMHLVTHDKEKTTYDDYIKALSVDKDATDIKLADLRHNTLVTRLRGLGKKDHERIEKYHRWYIYLSDIYPDL